jgi:hypothetical protein
MLGVFFADPGINVLCHAVMSELPIFGTALRLGTTEGMRERAHAMER